VRKPTGLHNSTNTGRFGSTLNANRSTLSVKQEFLPLGSTMKGHLSSKSPPKMVKKPKNDLNPGEELYKFPSMSAISKMNNFSPL